MYGYDPISTYPTTVRTASSTFTLEHDRRGGLVGVTLPSGHAHSFRTVPLMDRTVVEHKAPWDGDPTRYVYDGSDGPAGVFRPDGSVLDSSGGAAAASKGVVTGEGGEVVAVELSSGAAVRRSMAWTCLDTACFDYVINCTLGGEYSGGLAVTSDVVTKETIGVGDFIFERSR